MCGISGIFGRNGRPPARAELGLLNAALAHRGPDGEGLWYSSDRTCALAHRRLAIIDPQLRSSQPMASDDGRYAIVFNGEMYDFLEIRASLEAKGHVFRTESDTEVILAAWRQWGSAMLDRFNGMWALSIYDQEKGELFLARDRFGVKPLLYSEHRDRFAFASETRALLALPWLSPALDVEAARRVLFDPFSLEAGERTLYRDIRRLPAGHHLRVSRSGSVLTRWWRTADHLVEPPATLAEAAEEFRERFFAAIRMRMRSDVPIGTCLSGGFDSSAIVAGMRHVQADFTHSHARESKDWRHAFIASFPAMANDETSRARLAGAYGGIDRPCVIDLSRDRALADMDVVLDTMEDIFISLPTAVWKTYRAVKAAGIRVTLDGHGADELMGGYRQGGRPFRFLLQHALGSAPGRGPILGTLNDFVKLAYLRATGNFFLRDARLPPDRLPSPADRDRLPKHWGLFNRRLYAMVHSTILPTLMRNFDRLSMAHSVEVRSPFLDWQLVPFLLSLPDHMKSGPDYSKLVAREAMRGRMPESIRVGTWKIGFGSQMPEWLNGELGTWIEAKLARPHPAFEELVDVGRMRRRVVALNRTGRWDWESASRLWPYAQLNWLLSHDRRRPQWAQAA
jgi:asparagine synthase (glutamine-hydrolysing)